MFKKLLINLPLFLIAGLFYFYTSHEQIQFSPENVIFSSSNIQLSVPSCPLKTNSLIINSFSQKPILDWDSNEHTQSYHLLENIASLWRQNGTNDFLVIGSIPSRMDGDRFFWEIVPYPKTTFNLLEQLGVVWRLTFGSPCLSKNEQKTEKNKYQKFFPHYSQDYQALQSTPCQPNDAFCNPKVIKKQLLYEGKTIDLLYNYAPQGVGSEKLHFLLITKKHRAGFPELTLEEYLEAQEVANKIIRYFNKKGFPIVYLFHKTGKLAGQTVPHWHEHLIFASDESAEFWGKLKLMGRMIFPASPLSDPELEKLVKKYREQVQQAMKK